MSTAEVAQPQVPGVTIINNIGQPQAQSAPVGAYAPTEFGSLSADNWYWLFDSRPILHGYFADGTGKQSYFPALLFNATARIPNVPVNKFKYSHAVSHNATEKQLIESGYTSVSASGGVDLLVSGGFSFSTETSSDSFNSKTSCDVIAFAKTMKGDINTDPSNACFTVNPEFVTEVQKAQSAPDKIVAVRKLLKKWGQVFPTIVSIGTMMYSSEHQSTSDVTVNSSTAKKFSADFEAIIEIVKAGASADVQSTRNTIDKNTMLRIKNSLEVKGGVANLAKSDLETWLSTCNPYTGWDVIGFSELIPIWEVLPAEYHAFFLENLPPEVTNKNQQAQNGSSQPQAEDPRVWQIELKRMPLYKCGSDAGSGANMDILISKPEPNQGWYYLGQRASRNEVDESGGLVMRPLVGNTRAMKSVLTWTKLWEHKTWSVWRGVTNEDDYVVLGDYWKNDDPNTPPSDDKIMAIHRNLLMPGVFCDHSFYWCDRGSGARSDLSIHGVIGCVGSVPTGLFVANDAGYDRPLNRELFSLNSQFIANHHQHY